MESEAINADGLLRSRIETRRRTQSFSDDYSVQKTNDDATECKYAAQQMGYFTDNFVRRFVIAKETIGHRDPEILRGYWARVVAIKSIVDTFLMRVGVSCQIINLGAGFDTLYWRLKSEGKQFKKFVDVDFSSVTSKKIRMIMKPGEPNLLSFFSKKPEESHHEDLHAGDYQLLGADLRQSKELKEKLESAGLDFDIPTIFIAECVLVYMSVDKSRELLSNIPNWFRTAVFINYEQVCISDSFGSIMLANLLRRGIVLPGIPDCENLEAQSRRFLETGWQYAIAAKMDDIYKKYLPEDEVHKIEKIGILDEPELLFQLLEHYCIVISVKSAPEFNDLKEILKLNRR